ncbi:helix-turn-helix domain-containing protein [[Mycobacterium] wendilense]|uniref:Helix-turn-helix domain-containing protein n=1 Tax=[Mycobacterium] wendilense TaxID=3064284 RepID=A0ABN9PCU2_9MYCO|nr:helix-turn-helix domain-containing protein [Mycolicibacterium sp. MU0050]CAJ1587542.1 helix-turn-helix domain-containing protein [Mycolicibacterium sp. MU0050]
MPTAQRRPRGRPAGGGISADQAKTVLMDAAEELFIANGYRATTMEAIAQHAGYSRAAIYRQFPNRRALIAAMVNRTTQHHMAAMLPRLPEGAGLITVLVEALVIVASELVEDPLLRTISEQAPDGTIASMIAEDPALVSLVEATVAGMGTDDSNRLRPGLRAHDVAQFIIATALSLLLHTVPGTSDPDVTRRYLQTFVLPALVHNPPPPSGVFPQR